MLKMPNMQVHRSQGLHLTSDKFVCHHTMDKNIDSYLILEQNSLKINKHPCEKSLRISYFNYKSEIHEREEVFQLHK